MRTSNMIKRIQKSRSAALIISVAISVAEFPAGTMIQDRPQFADVQQVLMDYITYVLIIGSIGTLVIIFCAMAAAGLLKFSGSFPRVNHTS